MSEKQVKFNGKKPLTKKIKKNTFEKKILKKIYIESDKNFILSLYSKDENENYILNRDTFSQDEVKKIKSIADAINKNKGGIFDLTKVSLLIVVVAGIVVFNLLFKNMLLTNALRSGLESIFNAKAEVKGLNFQILKAKIDIKHIAVANADAPMKNLFELGKTQIHLNSKQLLYGKFIVENIECQNIKWNTDRKTSGELLKKSSAKKGEQKTQLTQEKKESQLFDISKIDVNKILEENKTNIKSLLVISNANLEIGQLTNKWDTNLKETKKKIDETSKGVEEIKKIDIASIKTIEQGQQAINNINSYILKLDSLKKDIEKQQNEFSEDKKKIEDYSKNIKKSVDGDIQYFSSLIKLPTGDAKGIFMSMAKDFIAKRLGKIYFYSMKGLQYANAFKDNKPKDKKEKKKEALIRRKGRNVYFPTKTYPKFLIKNIETSIDQKTENLYVKAYIKDISSDPNLWGKPFSFYFNHIKKEEELSLDGNIDVRSNASEPLNIEFKANNFPFEVKETIGFINVKELNGIYKFKTAFTIDNEKGTKGIASILLNKVNISLSSEDTISKIVYEVIKETQEISFEISYLIGKEGDINIEGRSNLDKIIADKLGKIIEKYAKEYEKQLKDYLNRTISEELKKNETLAKAFGNIDNILNGNMKDIDAFKKTFENKKKEINDKIKNEAESKAKDIIKDAPKDIKLPKF